MLAPSIRLILKKSRWKKGVHPLRRGHTIEIQALKFSRKPYRWWRATVEARDREHISTLNRIGESVHGVEPGWVYKHNHRNIFWFERPYNLVEVYERDGRLKQLYVHIASLPIFQNHRLVYIDHELDVVWRPGQAPRVADEAEFLVAVREFGYSAEFQSACWRAVEEALELVRRWKPIGSSAFLR